MTVIACLSVKGAPGVTTLATGLAATWPDHRQVLLAEMDIFGGDISARFGVSHDKSIVSLAAAGRHGHVDAMPHTVELPGGLTALLGVPSAEQSRNAVAVLARTWLSQAASDQNSDVIVDCGRVDSISPNVDLLSSATHVFVCLRSLLSDVAHVSASLPQLRDRSNNISAIVIGNGLYDDSEIETALGVPVIARLPYDPVGAQLLGGERGSARAMGRSPLIRTCQELAADLADAESAEVMS